MKHQLSLSRMSLCSGVLALAMSPAHGDASCDTEVTAIQAVLDAPPAGISAADLEQATILVGILRGNCASGITLDGVAPISQQIRGLLGMGDAS